MDTEEKPEESVDPGDPQANGDSGPFKCGFVAILGEPNVGKSTLVNRLTGVKLAAVTPKPQTTRDRILGVATRPAGQMILVDTPGVHVPRKALNRYLVEQALKAIADADLAVLMIEPWDRPDAMTAGMERLLKKLTDSGLEQILVINKIDLLKQRKKLLPLIDEWTRRHPFRAVTPVSCLKADGLERLEGEILEALPEGPPLYPEEMYTDKTLRWLCQELIREQLTLALQQELPYSLAVEVERFNERPEKGDVFVEAVIYVERESQKPIVLGKGGRTTKQVGQAARREMTRLTGQTVHLKLRIKVVRNWTRNRVALKRVGYE